MPDDLSKQLGDLQSEITRVTNDIGAKAQSALDEASRLGGLTTDTKAAVDKQQAEQGDLMGKLEATMREVEQRAVSGRPGSGPAATTIGLQVMASAQLAALVKAGNVSGEVSLGVYNAITALHASGGELLTEQVESEIISEPERKLRVRDLITVGSTSQALMKFFREESRTGAAGIVPDDGVTVKPLIDKTYVGASAEVVTIAGRMEIHKHNHTAVRTVIAAPRPTLLVAELANVYALTNRSTPANVDNSRRQRVSHISAASTK